MITVLLTGHTGLSKTRIIERLAAQEDGVRHFPAEGKLFLDTVLPSHRDTMNLWWQSFDDSVVKPWKELKEKPRISIISMHLTWQIKSHFFSPLISTHAPQLLEFLRTDFRPDFVVTLIDDVYRCQQKITEKGYSFGLGELLRWRNVEILLSDMLAGQVVDSSDRKFDRGLYPFERSPVFAINHPIRTLFRYILERNVPRIYLSYPITGPRKLLDAGDHKPANEINHFRSFFSQQFTCFDPVTIDERPLAFTQARFEADMLKRASSAFRRALPAQPKRREKPNDRKERLAKLSQFFSASRADAMVKLSVEDRWPKPRKEYLDSLIGELPVDVPSLSLQQIVGVTASVDQGNSEIDRQIRMRDFRLIDQSDCVVIYRPTYLKKDGWSGGTKAELEYAQTAAKKPVWVITDRDVDTPLNDGPFGQDLPPGNRIEAQNLSNAKARTETFERVAAMMKDRIAQTLQAGLR